jgi:hypothetical protein
MLFEARVESISRFLDDEVRPGGDAAAVKRVRADYDRIARALRKAWPRECRNIRKVLYDAGGKLVSHMQIDRFGVLHDLRECARRLRKRVKVSKKTSARLLLRHRECRFAHTQAVGAAEALLLPFDFDDPVNVELDGRPAPYPVASAPRVAAELSLLNQLMQVDATFALRDLPPFLSAPREQIDRFETQFASKGGDFWAYFGFVLLRNLTRTAMAHNLPVIFMYAPDLDAHDDDDTDAGTGMSTEETRDA